VPEATRLDGVGDSLYPALGNGGYDVEHYSLAIEVDVEENVLDAVATIEAVANDDLDVFHLDLQGLEVLEVTVDGSEATVERSGHEKIAIGGFDVLDRDLQHGQKPKHLARDDLPRARREQWEALHVWRE
jgi:hypothetical protein